MTPGEWREGGGKTEAKTTTIEGGQGSSRSTNTSTWRQLKTEQKDSSRVEEWGGKCASTMERPSKK